MDKKIFTSMNKHKNKNKFYVIKSELYEGDSGTCNESGLGIDLDSIINIFTKLKNDGYKNVHFGSDDPYCGIEISVSKLENE